VVAGVVDFQIAQIEAKISTRRSNFEVFHTATALSGHAAGAGVCLLSEVKQTSRNDDAMSVNDPGCVKTSCFMRFSHPDSWLLAGTRMKRFIEGSDRSQSTLFPKSLEDWIEEDNPVRVIDVFVNGLDLGGLGFGGVAPEITGRPSYHPSVLLKLYIYGYLNRVQSGRRLEREDGRNVEVMWLTCRLVPDHKTIADFRKDCGSAIQRVCVQFVELCRQMGLLTTASVAIDGSKFQAVNTRDKNFTRGKVERRRAQLEESVARYLAQLDTADRQEPSEELAAKTAHLREKLVKLEGEMQRLAAMEKSMLASPDQQISLTDPDSRSMATSGRGSGVVGYNVQVAVDTDHHLIIAHEVTNTGSDRAQLANIASRAKDAIDVDKLEAIADRGHYSGEEILACDKAGIDAPQADDIRFGSKGVLRQTGLCLSRRRGRVSLPGRREAELPLYQRRGRAAAPALLDQCMPRCAESALHNRQGRSIR
jgi:transposase